MSGKKHSFDYVKNYVNATGCEYLQDYYINSHTKFKYKCNCGNIAWICLSNFKQGKRCKECKRKKIGQKHRGKNQSNKRKFTLEYAQNLWLDNKCLLLATEYENSGAPMPYICVCGGFAKISLSHFKNGQRCRKCKNRKIGLKNKGCSNGQWNSDRNQIRLNRLFRRKCKDLLRRTLGAVGTEKEENSHVLLGYAPKELQKHIIEHRYYKKVESKKWQLDHIYPIKAFMDYGITNLKLINCLENLQPLSAYDNNTKHDKYNKQEFEAWLTSKNISFESQI